MSNNQTPASPSQPGAQPPPAPPPASVPPTGAGSPSKDEKTLAMLCHLLGALVGFLVPLIIWLVKKDSMPFVDDQAREALNFQIAVLIAFAACGVLTTVTCGFGAVLFLPLWVADLVFGITAAMKANEGTAYRYPYTLRLIK